MPHAEAIGSNFQEAKLLCVLGPQDTFGAEFKALQAADTPEDGEAAAAEQPEELDRKTKYGFWTAAPIWSTDSAATGAIQHLTEWFLWNSATLGCKVVCCSKHPSA